MQMVHHIHQERLGLEDQAPLPGGFADRLPRLEVAAVRLAAPEGRPLAHPMVLEEFPLRMHMVALD
jgi:hypothetical protein